MDQITVERLDTRACGVWEGCETPVPRVLPGEVVRLVDGAARIITPSEQRVTAPCRHYKTCGGCALQHASDDFVADWKRDVILRGLAAQGVEAEVRPTITSPSNSRRRATLHGRRTKKGVQVGFYGRASDTLVDTPDCLLVDPIIAGARPAMEALTREICSRTSTLSLSVTASAAGPDIAAVGEAKLDRKLIETLGSLAGEFDLARLSYNGEVIATLRRPEQVFGAARVVPPPGAFLQATSPGEDALTQCVAKAVGDAGKVVDLFCGAGTFALRLASGAAVHGVEAERSLIDALDLGWRHAQGLQTVTTEVRDLFRQPLLDDELARYGAVVLDPPRAGAAAQVEQIVEARVPRIAYVSCSPITFARDARVLTAAGYHLDWVQPVDQFRWSAHIELAAGFALTPQ